MPHCRSRHSICWQLRGCRVIGAKWRSIRGSCPTFDPAGTRLLAGSEGGVLKLFEFDLSAPSTTESTAITRARQVPWRAPTLAERTWVATGPCVGFPMLAGALGFMALTSHLTR